MKTTKGSMQLLKAMTVGAIALSGAWIPAHALPAPATVTYRNGVSGYVGTVDTYIGFSGSNASPTPLPSEATASLIVIDSDPTDQGLLRFDSIFGSGPGQIPAGATITSATLTIWTGSTANDQSANAVNLHRLLHPWNAADLWAAYGVSPWNATAGIQNDGTDALAAVAGTATINAIATSSAINVTTSLQAWLASPSSNYGWAILPTGTDGLRLESSESTTASSARRPTLSVTYIPPCTTDAECSDGAACTVDSCNSGVCQNVSTCVGGLTCNVGTSTCEAARSFQNGVSSYGGTVDTYIDAALGSQAATSPIVVDGSPVEHILLRFDSIFGSGPGQIPAGSTVASATLTLWVGAVANDASPNAVNFHRLLHPWIATDLWAAYGVAPWNATPGIQADGVDAVSAASATATMSALATAYPVSVTTSLQAWTSNPASNFGWAILPTGTDGLRLESSESTTASNTRRPTLSVVLSCLWVSATDATCDGIDDDCDGSIDEDFVSSVTSCGIGPCAATGATSCVGGIVANSCVAGSPISLTDTTCNGIDDNCNGTADEGYVPVATTCGVGACASTGEIACSGGVLQPDTCTPGAPGTETCNNLDDDCDGVVDNGNPGGGAACGTDVGECVSGTMTCIGGALTCQGSVGPVPEVCDNLDNDCDGTLDNGTNQPTTCGVGACAATGEIACSGGILQPNTCTPGTPGTEICNNLDDDCDGVVDNGNPGGGATCGTDVGECVSGTMTCVSGALTCQGSVGPVPEACDNLDNDCDGTIDGFAMTCGVAPCNSNGICTAGACVPGVTEVSCRAEHYLVAKVIDPPMSVNGTEIQMWGFAPGSSSSVCNGPEVATVPGPALAIPHGTHDLTIHVLNCLNEPISLVIPGLIGKLDPTFVDGNTPLLPTGSRPAGDFTSRIRSFNTEVPPNGVNPVMYVWHDVQPGTYLYQSGTRPDVQVQMGLYGMLRVNVANGEAYPGVHYDNEALMIYSEIDPRRPIVPSTLGYSPEYFLVNGKVYPGAAPVLDHPLVANEKVLFRFLNAGLQSHVPTLLVGYVQAVAEDGHRYPYARDQYGVLLPAGKTLDAIWTPDRCGGSVPLLDRRLWLSNPGVDTPGGMLVQLNSAGSNHPGAPTANGDAYTAVQGQALIVAALGDPPGVLPGVLANDSSPLGDPMTAVLVAGPAHGTLVLDPNGGFRYTPAGDYTGPDSFTYKANDCEDSNVATVSLTVGPELTNNRPTALDDSYSVTEDAVLHTPAPGVLLNDSDVPPGPNPLTAVLNTGVSHGTLVFNPNGSFDYTPMANYNGSDAFTYRAYDGQLYSVVRTVSLVVSAVNDAPVANDDTAQTKRQTPVTINVLANDTDADGNAQINPATRTIVVYPRNGTLTLNASGSVTYIARPGFVGSDQFSYTVRDAPAGALSNVAAVRVNVVK